MMYFLYNISYFLIGILKHENRLFYIEISYTSVCENFVSAFIP